MGDITVFEVEGKPQGKARARTFYNTKLGRMQSITPEQTKSYEELIRWKYKEAKGAYYKEAPLRVSICAYYPIPKSFSKAKQEDARRWRLRPTTKPDCDNIIKVVLDALNGVAYYDDKQVIEVSCSKYYAENARLEVMLVEEVSI